MSIYSGVAILVVSLRGGEKMLGNVHLTSGYSVLSPRSDQYHLDSYDLELV